MSSLFNKITSQLFHHANWKGYWEPVIQLFLPAWRDGFYRAQVTAIKSLSTDVLQLTISPENKWPTHRAGQHIALTIEVKGKLITRVFTIASGATARDRQGEIRLAIKVKNDGALTPSLRALRKGSWINISSPMGEFTLPSDEPVLMIAGGSGITPFIAMLEDAQQQRRKAKYPIHLLYYARPNEHLMVDELNELTRRVEDFSFQLLTRVNDGEVETHLANYAEAHWLVCGPHTLYQQVAQNAETAGISLESEHFIAFPRLTGEDGSPKQQFALKHNETTLSVNNQNTLLEQLQQADIPVTYGCGMGICHQCQCIKKRGVVRDTRTGELSDSAEQLIQLCVSQAATDLELQA